MEKVKEAISMLREVLPGRLGTGENMPKRQSCPMCGSKMKRGRKSSTGAFYICCTHGEFSVIRRT